MVLQQLAQKIFQRYVLNIQYEQIISSLVEKDKLVEYIKDNKDKKIKELLVELNISRFKLNKILKNINLLQNNNIY